MIIATSCNKDYNTIGINLITNKPFNTSVKEVPVFVKMKKIPPYVVNQIQTFQLGTYQDNIYGKTEVTYLSQLTLEDVSPVFGIFKQDDEINGMEDNIAAIPEEETLKDVFLDIPYFTNVDDDDNDGVINLYDVDSTDPESDSDGDGWSDLYETQIGQNPLNPDTDGDGILDPDDDESKNPNGGGTVYELDSLMGNSKAKFKLKVSELDYYLRAYDPESNFEKFQKYYSDNDIPSNFSGAVLFDDEIEIDSNELVFYNEDDPETTEEDESETVKERLTPRIRVSLNKDFFQKKIIDNEGKQDLINNENFKLFIKLPVGIIIWFSEPFTSNDVAQDIKVSQIGYTASLQRRTEQGNVTASGASAKAVTFTNPFFVGTSSLLGANTNLPSVGINAQNMASGDFFEVSSVSGSGFTVHFKNSSNASIDRNFTYQAVGFGKGG